jgi:hypothetical protein
VEREDAEIGVDLCRQLALAGLRWVYPPTLAGHIAPAIAELLDSAHAP